MNYTCEFCTDYIQPDKKEEILQNVARIIAEAMKNASSGMAVPSDADKNNIQCDCIT